RLLDRRARRAFREVPLNLFRKLRPNPRSGGELSKRRGAQTSHRPEMLQQGLDPFRAETGHFGQLTGYRCAPALTLERNRKPMGLVTDALHQKQGFACTRENNRKRVMRNPDLFEPFGDSAERD